MYVCRNITFSFLRYTNADFVPHDCMNFLSFNCIRIYNTPYTRYFYSCYSSIQYLNFRFKSHFVCLYMYVCNHVRMLIVQINMFKPNLHSVLRMKGYEIFCLSYIRSSLCAKADTFSAMYFALLSRMTYFFNKNQNYVYTSF